MKKKHYLYNLTIITKTIWNYKTIKSKAKINFEKYKTFCYNYPRNGKWINEDGTVIFSNNLQYHFDDLKSKYMMVKTFENNDLETLELATAKGPISALVAKNSKSNKWVIGLHGWTEDKYLALRLVFHYYQQGYNILTFDAFAHGLTYGDKTDIGMSSVEIIDCLIEHLQKTYSPQSIGLIGNSMGASTSVLYSQIGKYKNKINWVVADCGFSSLKQQYRYFIENNFFHNCWWIEGYQFTKKFSKETKTNQNKYNLTKGMKRCSEVPILFIHGQKDTFVPWWMSQEMYDKKRLYETNIQSEIWTPPDANHVAVIAKHYELYKTKTLEFGNKWEKNNEIK
ncbi:alpha/beta hydrolase [Mesoplasma syrphidae]|uniref:Alpha/beta hydrolase n=1 Tax=Mesoplasma syrphidae TaxID=225999 RepID=A0A2K9BR50_9MOLU|nr:alpha/beta hydrolase [Mesoplasma syrphidae]AUF83482.1 alpha/beta hydrolase [Mesoplasma syrphidae]